MKKPQFPVLCIITCIFAAFTIGFFFGRSFNHSPVQVSVPAVSESPAALTPEAAMDSLVNASPVSTDDSHSALVNINTATQDELMTLPGIGEVYARRIIEYRTANGLFHAVEELLNVQGIGEKRLEALLDLITVGG